MQSYNFQTTVHGKWLLAGEHAVLRGNPALVFPIPDKLLTLSFHDAEDNILVDFKGSHGPDLQLLFWGVLEHGLDVLQIPIKKVIGAFKIDSNIPIGAGLGVSAAICTAVTRWFAWQKWIDPAQINEFAQKLEHLFHSESSGVDIAGVSAKNGIVFRPGESNNPIDQQWEPHWYLSYTEQVGITSKCVKTVKELWRINNPHATQKHIRIL